MIIVSKYMHIILLINRNPHLHFANDRTFNPITIYALFHPQSEFGTVPENPAYETNRTKLAAIKYSNGFCMSVRVFVLNRAHFPMLMILRPGNPTCTNRQSQ